MNIKDLVLMCSALFCVYWASVSGQTRSQRNIPRTRFTCQGRPAGYYADVDTGCQVYHMCDGLGRQFIYSCPNTTLFQQRMLVCDHWYMVNCSMSERDYDANLLIGQRDKPFVTEEDMRQRTPRPDILSVPLNSNYYEGLKEAESKFPVHPGNSISGVVESVSADNSGLDAAKNQRPISWTTGTKGQRGPLSRPITTSTLRPAPTFRPEGTRPTLGGPTIRPDQGNFRPTVSPNNGVRVSPPSLDLSPPFLPTTTEPDDIDLHLDARMKPDDSVVEFVKRFDPNAPEPQKTPMTQSEIIKINKDLPKGQVNVEEDRNPKTNKNFEYNLNKVEADSKNSRFDTINTKPSPDVSNSNVAVPDRELLPPKTETEESIVMSTTVGPPIYYEWKWAVPAFGLQPPKESNDTRENSYPTRSSEGKQRNSPFSTVRRPPPIDPEDTTPEPKVTEYNISSYLVPDYVFPLDNPHPGYDSVDAQTSFQVKVAGPGKTSYGENPACPQCHPAYLKPGSCEPCVLQR